MIEELLQFTALTHQFQQIRRKVLVNGEQRGENDSEHSFQLALLAWYIIQKDNLSLNTTKVFRYSLAHDLVELYAGDTFAHDKNPDVHATKKLREHYAAQRLQTEWPNFPELHEAIAAYEARSDEESKFVYALDKMLPPLNIYLDSGRSWQVHDVTLGMVREYKTGKIALSPPVDAYWQELLALMEENQDKLFTHPTN